MTGTARGLSRRKGECDFRHGLAEATITRDEDGPVLSFVHDQTRVSIALSEHSLAALYVALATSIGAERC